MCDDLTCAPAIHTDFRMVGEVVGKLCPFCHHTNVVHDAHRNICVLCDLQSLTASASDARATGATDEATEPSV